MDKVVEMLKEDVSFKIQTLTMLQSPVQSIIKKLNENGTNARSAMNKDNIIHSTQEARSDMNIHI